MQNKIEHMKHGKIKYVRVSGEEATTGFRGWTEPPSFGMLFDGSYGFVMNGVGVDLDIAYMDDDYVILEFQRMQAEGPATVDPVKAPDLEYRGKSPYAHALEVPAGWYASNNWNVGDRVYFNDGYASVELPDMPMRVKHATKHPVQNRTGAYGVEMLSDSVIGYLTGPCALRWGMDAVRQVLGKLRILPEDPDAYLEPKKISSYDDILKFRDFTTCGAIFELYSSSKTPTLYIVNTGVSDVDIVKALSMAIHESKLGCWLQPLAKEDISCISKVYGFSDEYAQFYTGQIVACIRACRKDEILGIMEALLYLHFIGTPDWEMKDWLRSVLPDRVKSHTPELFDFIWEQYKLSPEELKRGGWNFTNIVTTDHVQKHTAQALYSVVSVPKPTLDPAIWDNIESDKPTLKPTVKEEILSLLFDGLRNAGYQNPEKWCARILLIGGSTSNQYETDSDIDVTVILDYAEARREFDDSVTDTVIANSDEYVKKEAQYLKYVDNATEDVVDVIRDSILGIGPTKYVGLTAIAASKIAERLEDKRIRGEHVVDCTTTQCYKALQKLGSNLVTSTVPVPALADILATNITRFGRAVGLGYEADDISAEALEWARQSIQSLGHRV